MHRTLRHHGCTTGRSLWVVITVTLGLALGQQATAATECARETPLPADVHLIAPGAEVPEAVAQFAGAWAGGVGRLRWAVPHAGRRGGVGERLCPGHLQRWYLCDRWVSRSRGSCASPAGSSTGYCAFTCRNRSAPSSPIGWPARRCRAPSRANAVCA